MWSVIIIITQPIRNQKGIDKTKCCIAFALICPAILWTKQLLIDWIMFAPLWQEGIITKYLCLRKIIVYFQVKFFFCSSRGYLLNSLTW